MSSSTGNDKASIVQCLDAMSRPLLLRAGGERLQGRQRVGDIATTAETAAQMARYIGQLLRGGGHAFSLDDGDVRGQRRRTGS